MATFKTEEHAIQAAQDSLGPDAKIDQHFVVTEITDGEKAGRFIWEETGEEVEVPEFTAVMQFDEPEVEEVEASTEDLLEACFTEPEPEPEPEAEETAFNDRQAAIHNATMAFMIQQASLPAPVVVTRKEKDAKAKPRVAREQRNGVKKPADPNGKCGQVWTACDAFLATTGNPPTSKDLNSMVENNGLDWNKNNASIEFYCWRKFYGITPYQKAVEANNVVTTPTPTLDAIVADCEGPSNEAVFQGE